MASVLCGWIGHCTHLLPLRVISLSDFSRSWGGWQGTSGIFSIITAWSGLQRIPFPMAGHNRLERQKLISPSGCCWSVQRNWDSHPTPSHQPADDLFYWGKWVVRAPPLFVNSYVWKILFSLCSCLTSDETTVFLPKSWFMMMSEWFSCWLCQLIQSPAGYRGIGKCWRNLQCKEGSAAIPFWTIPFWIYTPKAWK